jgi:hypothetical protein
MDRPERKKKAKKPKVFFIRLKNRGFPAKNWLKCWIIGSQGLLFQHIHLSLQSVLEKPFFRAESPNRKKETKI